MITNPNVLIVGPDATTLESEFDSALEGLPDVRAVVHTATSFRPGLEALRSRRPDLAVVEMGANPRTLLSFAEEAALASPETTLVAAFRPEALGDATADGERFIEALRVGVRDFLRRPLSPADLHQLLERLEGGRCDAGRPHGKVIAFVGNKGGVGRSTLAVHAACGLARRLPERVLLIDAAFQFGTCASLLDLAPATTIADAARGKDRLDETLIRQLATPHVSGLHLLAAPPEVAEAARLDDEILARVLTVARRAYDYVIVDTLPLFDRVLIAILDIVDRAYVVVESAVPTVLGAVKLLALLENLGVPPARQRLILNRHARWGSALKPADVAARLERDVDLVVPYDAKVIAAGNTGRPLIGGGGLFGFARALRSLIDDLAVIESASQRTPRRAERAAILEEVSS